MKLSQNTQKLVDINNLDFGELGIAENIVMMVLGDDIFCVGFKGTIHELVIVRIGCDKPKMINISRQLVSRTMFIIGYMACACVRSSILQ